MKIYCVRHTKTDQDILDSLVGTDIWVHGIATALVVTSWVNIVTEDDEFYYARNWPYCPEVSIPIELKNFSVSELDEYCPVVRIPKADLIISRPLEIYKTNELFFSKGDKQ